jgi:hypothetical protein
MEVEVELHDSAPSEPCAEAEHVAELSITGEGSLTLLNWDDAPVVAFASTFVTGPCGGPAGHGPDTQEMREIQSLGQRREVPVRTGRTFPS